MQGHLYRSSKNRIIAGICGGLGEYFDVDPSLFRLLWILLIFAGGAGIWAYLIAWIVIPENPKKKREDLKINDKVNIEGNKKEKKQEKDEEKLKSSFLGYGLIILGAVFLINNFFPTFGFDRFWPIIIIAIGATILITAKKD